MAIDYYIRIGLYINYLPHTLLYYTYFAYRNVWMLDEFGGTSISSFGFASVIQCPGSLIFQKKHPEFLKTNIFSKCKTQ